MGGLEHQIDVTNNSYFMDPCLHNCRTDPAQRALWKAAKRAIDYAQKQGVTVVASEGNQSRRPLASSGRHDEPRLPAGERGGA